MVLVFLRFCKLLLQDIYGIIKTTFPLLLLWLFLVFGIMVACAAMIAGTLYAFHIVGSYLDLSPQIVDWPIHGMHVMGSTIFIVFGTCLLFQIMCGLAKYFRDTWSLAKSEIIDGER